jgi:phage-related protein
MSTSRPSFALLSVVANIERHKLSSGDPFLLLMDLAWPPNVPPNEQTHLRFVRDLNPIAFDAGDGNGAQEYTPFNFDMGDLKVATDGTVPDCEVMASNVMLALQQAIEQYAGAVGASLDLYVVNTTNLAGEPELALSFTVKQTTSDNKNVHFTLGASSPMRRLFPIFYYYQNYCMWRYNSPLLQSTAAAAIAAGTPLKDPPGAQCGYIGTMTTCSHTIDGATGCQAHGNLVRIGTFPGIGTNGSAVASVA